MAVLEVDVGDVAVASDGAVAVAHLADAVTALVGADLDALSGEELLEVERDLEVVRRRLDAATDRVAGQVESSGAFGVDGHRGAAAALRHLGRLPGAEARARVRTARLLARLPAVAAAYDAGTIPTAHVRAIVRVASNPRVQEYLAVADPVFAEQASCEPYEAFAAWLREWERLADADGAARDADAAHARRRATVHADDEGGVSVDARLAGLEGAVVAEVFDRYLEAEWHADWADARALWGELATESMLARTPAQRRADALVAVFRTAAGAQSPVTALPLVNIVVDQASFEEHLASLVDPRRGQPTFGADASVRDLATDAATRRCQTLGGAPVHPTEAVAAALVGHVRRVVVDGDGCVIDLGRRRRLFTGAARDAALLQGALQHPDGLRCLWPGCHRRHGLEVDHREPAARGGPTDQANAQILCGVHNRLKEHGFRPVRRPDGRWTIIRPDGTPITPRA